MRQECSPDFHCLYCDGLPFADRRWDSIIGGAGLGLARYSESGQEVVDDEFFLSGLFFFWVLGVMGMSCNVLFDDSGVAG